MLTRQDITITETEVTRELALRLKHVHVGDVIVRAVCTFESSVIVARYAINNVGGEINLLHYAKEDLYRQAEEFIYGKLRTELERLYHEVMPVIVRDVCTTCRSTDIGDRFLKLIESLQIVDKKEPPHEIPPPR